MAREHIPGITWGAAFANTLVFKTPLGTSLSVSQPREGSAWAESAAGIRDAWVIGHEQLLVATVRLIPIADIGGVTGWDGATGWRAFIEWAQEGNPFRFMPDSAFMGTFWLMYLIEPSGPPEQNLEVGYRHRALAVVFRTTDDTVITGY